MNNDQALLLAEEVIKILKPYCNTIEIAGSLRRKKAYVKDIEIVATTSDIKRLKNNLGLYLHRNKSRFIKSGNKYMNFEYKELIMIDLFIAEENNYGLIYLIRTGSALFSKNMLARWKKVSNGGYSENGYLHDPAGKTYVTKTEDDVFKLLNLDYVPPELREGN